MKPTRKQIVLKSFEGLQTSATDSLFTPVTTDTNPAPDGHGGELLPSSDRSIKLRTREEPPPFTTSALEEQIATNHFEGARVLVVDDDAMIRESLVKVLRTEGCLVDAAATGIEALQYYEPDGTDVVLLDFNMPEKNGWDTYMHIIGMNPAQAVILVSGIVQPPGWTPVGNSPVFMEKPINVSNLLQCMRKIVMEPAATRRVRVAVQTIFTRSTRPHHGKFATVSASPPTGGLND